MVANQPMRCTTSSGLQPIAASATRAARTARGLRTADLLRPSAAEQGLDLTGARRLGRDRKSTRLNSSHVSISYAVFCLKKKKILSDTLQGRAHMSREAHSRCIAWRVRN